MRIKTVFSAEKNDLNRESAVRWADGENIMIFLVFLRNIPSACVDGRFKKAEAALRQPNCLDIKSIFIVFGRRASTSTPHDLAISKILIWRSY